MRVKAALLVALGLSLIGCHHRLPRLAAKGQHAEVVERVERSRFRPKHEAARAYASSLHALGRDTQALDALLLDYRRGGDVRSLVALADLERALGWRGLAAHHYGRALTHDRGVLEGREDVCGLFRERARAYLHAGEGEAADLDMRRVRTACGDTDPGDAALAAEADAAAQALVDRRVEGGLCPPPCTSPEEAESAATLQPALERALATSPAAVAALATAQGRSLPPDAIVSLLEAEARGGLGLALLGDDDLRSWVGAQSWADLAPSVMSASGPVAAYAQLRLASVLPDMPRASNRAAAREMDRWAEQALRIPDVVGWRVYASMGDIATAELTLAARWRPPKPTVQPGDPAPARVEHWSERLVLTEGTLEAAVTAARLRQAAGKQDLALRLMIRALRAGAEGGFPSTPALAEASVVAAIGWGRPWHALAMLDTHAIADPAPLRAAAASAVVLGRALCDGSCREDEDLGVVTRVMGEDWVDTTRAALLDWSLARRTRPAPSRGCPTVAELTEPDTTGPLADALRAAKADLRGPGVGETLGTAVASELRSWCAASLVLPAMVHGQHAVPAKRVSDGFSHAAEMNASVDLATAAKLAFVAGEQERALLLAVAAGGESADPRETWMDLARFAADAGARELELRALREALMVSPGLHDRAVHQRLVRIALGDVAVSWGQDTDGGRDATRRHVVEYLDPLPSVRRWSAEHALIEAVLNDGLPQGLDAQQRARLVDALGGEPSLERAHPRLLRRLREQAPEPASGPLHDAGLADAARAGALLAAPTLTPALADPRSFQATRVALATHARDWSERRRAAISLLVLGAPAARQAGWRALSDMAAASRAGRLDALQALVVQRPAAMAPKWGRWGVLEPTVVLEGQDNLVRVVLGLDLQPPLVGH